MWSGRDLHPSHIFFAPFGALRESNPRSFRLSFGCASVTP
nr:MAG TPA: WXG100 protein secretion system protein [Caudoviricetes sp.]